MDPIARVNWVKIGELNTNFFHKTVNMKNRKNAIIRLEAQEKIIEDEIELEG